MTETKQTQVVQQSGLGFFSVLQLILITLKLAGFIGWSWWLVLIPAEVYMLICLSLIGLVVFHFMKE